MKDDEYRPFSAVCQDFLNGKRVDREDGCMAMFFSDTGLALISETPGEIHSMKVEFNEKTGTPIGNLFSGRWKVGKE